MSKTDLNLEEQNELINLLAQYPDLYAMSENDAGRTSLVKHEIDTENEKPFKCRPFRIAPTEKEIIAKSVQKLEQDGVIRKSKSPWCTNVVLVRKKDGSHRMCIDFRGLNKVTRKDVYPLPRIDDILDTLNGMKCFSTLDQANAYWSIPIQEDDKEKTAFQTANGLYEFNFLPFGLCNAPATFQRLMDVLLSGLHWETCLVYLDDVMVYAKTYREMIERLRTILDRLNTGGMKLRIEKCDFFKRSVKYLGHMISSKGIQPDPNKIAAITKMPTRKMQKV